jgi:hypothetical protein
VPFWLSRVMEKLFSWAAFPRPKEDVPQTRLFDFGDAEIRCVVQCRFIVSGKP